MTTEYSQIQTIRENSAEHLSYQFSLVAPERFPHFFRRVRISCPTNVVKACILHLNEIGLDSVGEQMIPWLSSNDQYLHSLLDPEILSTESAKRIAGFFRKTDPQFFARLSRFAFNTEPCLSPSFLSRAMAILDDLSKDDPIVPWLRDLTQHPDERVRSKAVKTLCRLRPDKSLIEMHLQSENARVRANAVEALWHISSREVVSVFETALTDSHHRVVANALIGLHYKKESSALDQIIQFTEHSSPMFRLAMVWALGLLADYRAIPTLKRLLEDSCPAVSEKAKRVLATFGPEPEGAEAGRAVYPTVIHAFAKRSTSVLQVA